MSLAHLVTDNLVDAIGRQIQFPGKGIPGPFPQFHTVFHNGDGIGLHVRDMVFRVVGLDPPTAEGVMLRLGQVNTAKQTRPSCRCKGTIGEENSSSTRTAG